MSKQKSVIISEDQEKYAKYKWEFLRRNEEYIKDWENWNEQDSILPNGQFSKVEIQLCIKWKLGCPLNPELSYDRWVNINPVKEFQSDTDFDDPPGMGIFPPMAMRRFMFQRLNPDMLFNIIPIRIIDGWEHEHEYNRDGNIVHYYVSDKICETGKLTVEIDMNFSKNRLIKEFKILLDEWKMRYEDAYKKKLYRNFCEERNIHSYPIEENLMNEFLKLYSQRLKKRKSTFERKYHFDNFDDYLKVYDLRKEGVSWAKITSELDLNSVQTARNYYKSAREIINQGIDLYVK